MSKFLDFYKTSKPSATKVPADQSDSLYKKLRFQAFVAATLGYSLYYVCRTSLNVMKQPIIDSGVLDATQLGIIGACLYWTYAVGKFVNGFLGDYCNIKKFMATGLIVSAVANMMMGLLGLWEGMAGIASSSMFVMFAIMWTINGWSQSMGSPSAIIALSRWYPLNKRGTYYGFFSLSHNLGEFLSFLFVGLIVSAFGWQWGFIGSSIAGAFGVVCILFWMHDNPQSKGLPSVEEMANEAKSDEKVSTGELQKQVLKTPAVWILAAASAFMYIARYAINGWGVLFLQEAKGFSLTEATSIISINALLGIFGTVLSGWFSDVVFKGDRNKPAFIFGVMNTISLILFLFGGNAAWINLLAMVLFGISIGVLICFLGGLMAVDIVPRKATGAALGVVGCASYIAAGIQDVASGWLIDANCTTLADGALAYNFQPVAIFWVVASAISFMLPVLNWKKSKENN